MNDNEYRLHELLGVRFLREGISMRLGPASIDEFGNPENRNRNLADFGRFAPELGGGGAGRANRDDVVEFNQARRGHLFGGKHLTQGQGGMA